MVARDSQWVSISQYAQMPIRGMSQNKESTGVMGFRRPICLVQVFLHKQPGATESKNWLASMPVMCAGTWSFLTPFDSVRRHFSSSKDHQNIMCYWEPHYHTRGPHGKVVMRPSLSVTWLIAFNFPKASSRSPAATGKINSLLGYHWVWVYVYQMTRPLELHKPNL